MEKIDFANLGFGYYPAKYRFKAIYKDGSWQKGEIITDSNIVLNESACVLQYAQTVFEGLKAYKTKEGKVICFRPDLNGKRLYDSALRLAMPAYPVDLFLEAVKEVVKANLDFVPPYDSGASLYLRPVMFGTTPVLGVKPATEYEFRIFASVVGPYFKGKIKPITIRVTDYDRAAPNGTGNIKAGLNYAMSLYAITEAHNLGYDENLYLDSKTKTKVEETGGANIFFITKDNKLVTPKSNSILPSITRRSLLVIAKDILNIDVIEKEIYIDEIKDFKECALCGTGAVISPVGKIVYKDQVFEYTLDNMGYITKKLYDTLTQIQKGERPAPEGWIYEI